MSDYYENLINLLKLFKNRPHHLAKYLINNELLNSDFIEKLKKTKISDISEKELNFNSIEEMEKFYLSLINIENIEKKSQIELKIEINEKLDKAIELEDYEEAVRLRDFMNIKNIKRIKKSKPFNKK